MQSEKSVPASLLIPLSHVITLTNLSASSIRRLEVAGKFPARRQLSARRIGYFWTEIMQWAENRSKA